jgi:hypothetical protein
MANLAAESVAQVPFAARVFNQKDLTGADLAALSVTCAVMTAPASEPAGILYFSAILRWFPRPRDSNAVALSVSQPPDSTRVVVRQSAEQSRLWWRPTRR